MDEVNNSNSDWQLRCQKSRDRLSHLLYTKLWADCTFLVGDEEPESITAHKFVLAMSSPVFDTMFNGSIPEGKGPIRVPDVQPEAFKIMLKFLYIDETELRTYQEASEVYCVARKYMLPFIQTRCVNYLQWTLKPSNACFAHEFATLFEENDLLKVSLKIFKRKTKEVLKEGSFYEAHINTIATLFSQQELNIDTELDLFNALEKYSADTMGIRKLKRSINNNGSPSKRRKIEHQLENKTCDDDNKRQVNAECDENYELTEEDRKVLDNVRQAIPHIRFLTLTVQQFARAADSALLTVEEAFAVMLNLAGVSASLPEGISRSKDRRGVREWSPDYPDLNAASTSKQSIPRESPKNVASASKAAVYSAMCSFSVLNFKTRKRPVRSQPFRTDALAWQVNVVPGTEIQPNGEEQKSLGVMVECSSKESKPWACSAHVTIELVSRDKENLKRSFTNAYNSTSTSNGYRHLAPWTVVCNNFLRSNALRVDVRVSATLTQQ